MTADTHWSLLLDGAEDSKIRGSQPLFTHPMMDSVTGESVVMVSRKINDTQCVHLAVLITDGKRAEERYK